MEDQAGEEATRLGVLERLQARPASVEELSSSLGISQRVVSSLMERLVGTSVVEEVLGSAGGPVHSPRYRLSRLRPCGRNGGRVQPKVTPQQQHPYFAGMVPYGYAPYHGQQVIYYPAELGTYQHQQPVGPVPQWQRPGMPSVQQTQPQQLQQQGSGGAPGMQVGPMAGQQQMAGYTMQPLYYAAGGTPIAPPPLTPTLPSGTPPLPHAGPGSSASTGSMGWGGVALSQLAEEVTAGVAALPSPSSQQSQQELALADSSSQELPSARSAGTSSGAVEKEERAAPVAAATAAANGEQAQQQQQEQQQQQQQQQPPVAAGEPESASQAGPTSSEEGSEQGGEGQPRTTSGAAGSSNGGGGEAGSSGGVHRGGSSSGGSSGGSRHSRVNRERQPCAFFLKTGTCAYGDSCKFAHPFDKAPKVEFNSLGLPLRPGEPECSFYVKNNRCAFGHTCKFHHPELPLGGASMPVPQMYAMQYTMQYQSSGSPMLSSVLGLKSGPSSGGPDTPIGASPVSPAPGFFMVPSPYPGGFPGRPAMHHGFLAPAGMQGGLVHSGQAQCSNSGSSKAAATVVAAAAPAASAPAVPLPVPLPAGPRVELPLTSPSAHATDVVQKVLFGVSAAGPQAAVAADAAAASPDPPQEEAVAAPPAPALAPTEPRAGLQPIMVFNSQQQQSQQLTSALERLELQPAGEELVAAAAAPAAAAAVGGTHGAGVPETLPHGSQQQVDVVAAA